MTQTVLVTGAASGLGNVIAAHLLAEGFQVVLTDVDAARAAEQSWITAKAKCWHWGWIFASRKPLTRR